MRKSIEIKKLLDEQRTKVEGLQKQEMYDEAAKEAKGLNDLFNEYSAAVAMESTEISAKAKPLASFEPAGDIRKMHNRAFNKALLGEKMGYSAMTEEEAAYADTLRMAAGTPGQVGATPAKGGYLLPETEFNTILEFRRAYTELKRYCNVIPVNTKTGKRPTLGKENGKLINFDELNEINKDDIDFAQLTFSTSDYGDIIPVSNTLLADVDVNLTDIIKTRFTKKALNVENDKIIAKVAALTPTTITDYDGITTALNVTLDPAISATASIFTNQSGFDYLDKLKDAQKRPLLTVSLADPTVRLFKGRPIIVLPDSLLVNESNLPFVVGSMTDFVTFFDRQGVDMAISTEAGFTMNATYIRAIERFDVQTVDTDAMKYLALAKA